jgi:hypothetical protein
MTIALIIVSALLAIQTVRLWIVKAMYKEVVRRWDATQAENARLVTQLVRRDDDAILDAEEIV